MSWNNNDGPWGSSRKSGNNPSSKKDPPYGGNSGPPRSPPPDLEAALAKFMEAFRRWYMHVGGRSQFFVLLCCVLVGFWVLSGFYQVGTDQVGVVMRFGAFDRVDGPGLRYHAPYPVEDVLLPNVTSQNEIQIGFRPATREEPSKANVPQESMMLTQDENIINVELTVFWRVNDIQKFLFEIRDPEATIKMAAESAMREVIGQNKLQFALTDGRSQIAEDAKQRLQKLMDDYNVGVVISQINLQTVSVPDEVKAAFQDVVNAQVDQQRFQNEAETHANKVIPEAKGEAVKMTQEALGYRDQKTALAQGDADRFRQVLTAYQTAREVTAKRLYLETMESILSTAHKVILEKSAAGAVPYLPLQDFLQKPNAADGVNR